MHSSRCIPIAGFVHSVWLPRAGEQRRIPAGSVAFSAGLSMRRNHALWFSAGGQVLHFVFLHPGKPSTEITDGGLPPGRIIVQDDVLDVLITAPAGFADSFVWVEDLNALESRP